MLRAVLALGLALWLATPVAGALPAAAAPASADTIIVQIDNPGNGEQNMSPGWIAGWAVDTAAMDGSTGIDMVSVYMDGDQNSGQFLGMANYGGDRADVAFQLGSEAFRYSGFTLSLDNMGLSAGPHSFTVVAHSKLNAYGMASVSGVTLGQPQPAAQTGHLELSATLSNVSMLVGQNYYSSLTNYNGYLYPGTVLPNGTVLSNGTVLQNGYLNYNGSLTPIGSFLTPASTPAGTVMPGGVYNFNTALPGNVVLPYGTVPTAVNYNFGNLTPGANANPLLDISRNDVIYYQPYNNGYAANIPLNNLASLAPGALTMVNPGTNYYQGNAGVEAVVTARVTMDGQPVQGAQVSYQGYQLPPTDASGMTTGTVMFPISTTSPLQGTVTATYNGQTVSMPLYINFQS